jgi:hypothetical protein
MFQKLDRRRLFGAIFALSLVSVAAFAGTEKEVIGFVGASSAVAGQNYNGQVSTNESGMSVTFTSDPPGLVNYTTVVPGNGSSVAIPTNPNATGTLYRIVATPSSGGVVKTSGQIAVSPGL